jgi:hypothetical protein
MFADNYRTSAFTRLGGFWSADWEQEHIYLAGYAVELALKAVISRAFLTEAIPSPKFVRDIYSHDLDSLLNIARLRAELDQECASNERFAVNWLLVRDWSEQSRYDSWKSRMRDI